MSGEHAFYIAASYGFTALVVIALIAWALVRYRHEARTLAALEAKLGRSE
jgi:heme exporter protein CcmD